MNHTLTILTIIRDKWRGWHNGGTVVEGEKGVLVGGVRPLHLHKGNEFKVRACDVVITVRFATLEFSDNKS